MVKRNYFHLKLISSDVILYELRNSYCLSDSITEKIKRMRMRYTELYNEIKFDSIY